MSTFHVVGFCPVGFRLVGFCPVGFCPGFCVGIRHPECQVVPSWSCVVGTGE